MPKDSIATARLAPRRGLVRFAGFPPISTLYYPLPGISKNTTFGDEGVLFLPSVRRVGVTDERIHERKSVPVFP